MLLGGYIMEDYNKYLQGEYEGNEDNKRLQEDKDIERAKEIEEEIKIIGEE